MNNLQYAGFEQIGSKRHFRFDWKPIGRPALRLEVTAEIAMFSAHRVSLQNGPAICARRLATEIEAQRPYNHELTDEDLRLHAAEEDLAAARKARAHNRPRNRVPERRARSLRSGHWG